MARLRFVLPVLLGAIAPAFAFALSSSSCSLAGFASGGAGGTTASSSASGGAPSTSSSGGDSTASGGGTGGAPVTCPDEMVEIDAAPFGSFCIDKLEVTNADYLHFLVDAGMPTSSTDDLCAWNDSFEPANPPDASPPNAPVLGVDWCDAMSYCKSHKKRLCGRVGKGTLPIGLQNNSEDQWYEACSNNNAAHYPYGADASLEACADCDPDAGCDASAPIGPGSAIDVGTKSGCEGGVPGLYDMSGNAWEWQDSCIIDGYDGAVRTPQYDHCFRRGGGYDVPHVADAGGGNYSETCLECTACTSGKTTRKTRALDTGLRCCLDLSP